MRKFSLLLVAALLAGCGDGETYPLAAKDVRQKLLSINPPKFVFGDGKGVETIASQIGQDQVSWTVRADGKSMIRLIATVTPAGDGASKVSLTVEPSEGQARDQIKHNVATTSTALNLYHAAMNEQIDARLENRSFNMGAIQSQMAASLGTTFKQVDASLNEAVKNFDQQGRDREERLANHLEAEQDREIESASSDGGQGDFGGGEGE